jgi:hypothetical protein
VRAPAFSEGRFTVARREAFYRCMSRNGSHRLLPKSGRFTRL